MKKTPKLTSEIAREEFFEGFQYHVMPNTAHLSAKQRPLLATLFSRDKVVRDWTKQKYDEVEAEIRAVEGAHWAKCERYFKYMGWMKPEDKL